MRLEGELTIAEAADQLGIHPNTVRIWAQRALAGEPSRFLAVRLDVNGWYWIRSNDVDRILMENAEANGCTIETIEKN